MTKRQIRHFTINRALAWPCPICLICQDQHARMRMVPKLVIQTFWTYGIYPEISLITKGHFRTKFCPFWPKCGKCLDPPNLPHYMRIIQARRVRFARIFRKCPPVLRRVARHIIICPDLSAFQNVGIVVNISGQNGHIRNFTQRPTF
jgi:hypothetical protein